MINSISSSSSIISQTLGSSTSSSSLSSSQLESISSVLENYDADSLTQSDAQAIVASFQDAGIEPSSELEAAMEEAGFSAQEVGKLAGVQGGRGGGGMPPPPNDEEVSSVSSFLESLLSSDDEDDDEDSTTSVSSDDIMDYTSRILSLNDESKDKLLDTLSTYSNEDNGYTQEQTTALVKNSLNEILNDENNYKSVSFYG